MYSHSCPTHRLDKAKVFWVLTYSKSCSYGVELHWKMSTYKAEKTTQRVVNETSKGESPSWKGGGSMQRLVLENKHTLAQHIGFIVQAMLILVEVFPPHGAKTKES